VGKGEDEVEAVVATEGVVETEEDAAEDVVGTEDVAEDAVAVAKIIHKTIRSLNKGCVKTIRTN
jgi:D-ribose pyranose/furanose isomerase RbsD